MTNKLQLVLINVYTN